MGSKDPHSRVLYVTSSSQHRVCFFQADKGGTHFRRLATIEFGYFLCHILFAYVSGTLRVWELWVVMSGWVDFSF